MNQTKKTLEEFSKLLRQFWKNLERLEQSESTGSLRIDWLQANWEILVEGSLRDVLSDTLKQGDFVLEIYGEGADCNGKSSRVLFPHLLPTAQIVCTPENGPGLYDHLLNRIVNVEEGIVVFDSFVSMKSGGGFSESPPFDKVLCTYCKQEIIIDFQTSNFDVAPIPN